MVVKVVVRIDIKIVVTVSPSASCVSIFGIFQTPWVELVLVTGSTLTLIPILSNIFASRPISDLD